jgi:SH3-like domain-containing protein
MKPHSTIQLAKSMNAVAIATAFSFVVFTTFATSVLAQTTPPTPVAVAVAKPSFVNIGDKPAVLFDAPSTRANKTFIVLRHSPLEVLVKLDKWIKVRDHENTIGWVESDSLAARNTARLVIVNVALAHVRAAADDASSLIFNAERNVLLEVSAVSATAVPNGWLAVKHRDGQTGFIKATEVWGE